jgi:hypothetical protein
MKTLRRSTLIGARLAPMALVLSLAAPGVQSVDLAAASAMTLLPLRTPLEAVAPAQRGPGWSSVPIALMTALSEYAFNRLT